MMRLFNRFILCVFIAAVMMPLDARADGIIVLKPASEINAPSIRLSDVFSGIPDSIDRAIATAPAPGKSVTYNVRILIALADKYRLNWQPGSLADRAVLTRAATHITQDMIEPAILNKLKNENIKGKIDVLFDNRALDISLPASQPPQFTLNNFDYDVLNKRFRCELYAETGSAPVTLPVTGRIVVKQDVPVLARRLESGTTINKADIDWITVADDRLAPDVILDSSQLIGLELRHAVTEGQPLHARDVIPPRLVTRGSLVIMKIQTPNLLITAQGRAMQDGAEGDVVRVTNTQSKRIIEGIVDGAGIVRIQIPQRLALAQ